MTNDLPAKLRADAEYLQNGSADLDPKNILAAADMIEQQEKKLEATKDLAIKAIELIKF